MTAAQSNVLTVLDRRKRPASLAQVAGSLRQHANHTARSLDSLYRRAWVNLTEDGSWVISPRGRKALARSET